MIAGKESLDIEFKSDRDSLKDSVLNAVVAMANTDGGRIYTVCRQKTCQACPAG